MYNINYTNRIDKLKNRYNPDMDMLVERRTFSDTSGDIKDVATYVRRAMREVDESYTKKTKDAGEAVKQLLGSKLTDVEFEYQGSVMTDTHIRGASDIDLLTLCTKFYGTEIDKVRNEKFNSWVYNATQLSNLQSYDNRFSQYQGNSNEDLRQLRLLNEQILIGAYNNCDITKPKAIKITNHHYHRDVDIVTSSWFDSFDYVLNGSSKENRGIKIYNKDMGYAEGPDFPFLSISRINNRSAQTQGRLKRMIRFLKNVRTDADIEIKLTSFDINAICYDIPIADYQYLDYQGIVYLLWNKMYHLWQDGKVDNLKSVVGTEYVFKDKPDKVEALKLLENEVWAIYNDLK